MHSVRSRVFGVARVALLIAVGIAAGMLLQSSPPEPIETTPTTQRWTCAMHPHIRLPQPGQCPICFMDLVPVEPAGERPGMPRQLRISAEAAALMRIATAVVEHREVHATTPLTGIVALDDTRVNTITARVAGRLDRLFVETAGESIATGDPLAVLYSPELLAGQEALLQSLAGAQDTPAIVAAARDKLRLWGMTPAQLSALERRGRADEQITIVAPAAGVVVQTHVREGMYVNTGSPICTLADLSQVWINLEAYESDLPLRGIEQQIRFTTPAWPGDTFTGTVAFVQPVLDTTTRTVAVRVHAANGDGRLKPGMFVRATAVVSLHGGAPQPAEGWTCPMHPEIVQHTPGRCPRCKMLLVRAASPATDLPLVIPASAPLLTGTRAVVYVSLPGTDHPTFEGREIVLGPRAGDVYVVRQGLAAGERVVTRGAFALDAEMQIRARPSMMTPVTDAAPDDRTHAHHHEAP